ncbi:hypothetical protein ElyMa_001867900 [Elysia marginata]|uniref:Uncharacterized protein n=1 Tax=Elysia marginata TaxID=1093978 RepID=A0AAV4ENG4_9GAST|nr:hypothetical protein ElyMa_001867900 [Elysia marginata]
MVWHTDHVSRHAEKRLDEYSVDAELGINSSCQSPPLWPSGKDTRSEIGRYGFDPEPSQTKDFKIGISS